MALLFGLERHGFRGLTIAFVARRALSDDWASMPKRPSLGHTAILLFRACCSTVFAPRPPGRRRSRFNAFWTRRRALGILFSGRARGGLGWKLRPRRHFTWPPTPKQFVLLYSDRPQHATAYCWAAGGRRLSGWKSASAPAAPGPARDTAMNVTAVYLAFSLDGNWILLIDLVLRLG